MSYITTFMYQRVQRKPGKPQMRAGFSILCMCSHTLLLKIITYKVQYSERKTMIFFVYFVCPLEGNNDFRTLS